MNKYILVLWPDSQVFMDEPWFRQEAYLCNAHDEQEHHDSAYFIPEERYNKWLADRNSSHLIEGDTIFILPM